MAQERAAWLERRFGARVEWLPFDLHPEYPPEGIPREALEARYGPSMSARVREMAEAAGLTYRPGPVVSNSMRSLQLAEFARDEGGFDRLHPELFRAYWEEGRDIGDEAVLADVADRVGLDADRALAAVRGGEYRARVRGSTDAAIGIGVDGVPAWLVDERMLIPGAQPHEVFERVLARLGIGPAGDEPGSAETAS